MDHYEMTVLVEKVFHRAKPAEPPQIGQSDFAVTAVVQDLSEFMIRVYKVMIEGFPELEGEKGARNRMADQE